MMTVSLISCAFSVKANHSENPKTRMKDKEMISQMATFFLAGTSLFLTADPTV